jgi:hypothetical protein
MVQCWVNASSLSVSKCADSKETGDGSCKAATTLLMLSFSLLNLLKPMAIESPKDMRLLATSWCLILGLSFIGALLGLDL